MTEGKKHKKLNRKVCGINNIKTSLLNLGLYYDIHQIISSFPQQKV